MERNFAVVTIFTLLFAVSTARISLDPKPTEAYLQKCGTQSLPKDSSNLVVLPETSDEAGQKSDTDTDTGKMFRVDLTPRSEFARFHAINRRFSNHRHFQNPHGDELILKAGLGKSDTRNFHRHGESSQLKFKHEYKRHHRHQHQHQHHHNQNHHKNDNVSTPKHKLVRENTKSNLLHQHDKKTKGHEPSLFMKSIRKFLKHTFD